MPFVQVPHSRHQSSLPRARKYLAKFLDRVNDLHASTGLLYEDGPAVYIGLSGLRLVDRLLARKDKMRLLLSFREYSESGQSWKPPMRAAVVLHKERPSPHVIIKSLVHCCVECVPCL